MHLRYAAGPRACLIFDTDEKGLGTIKEQMLTANDLAVEGKPEDLVINTHVCRGNFHSTYAGSGSYDSVAKTLLDRENVWTPTIWSLMTSAAARRRAYWV